MSLTYPTGYFEEGYNLENKFLTRAAREKYQDSINPADYDTELTPNEQQEYNSWVKTMQATGKMAPGNERYDYDMQGFFKNEVLPQTEVGKSGSAETHFIDTYKKPNHRTFSNESKYYDKDTKKYAGNWKAYYEKEQKDSTDKGSANSTTKNTSLLTGGQS